MRLLSWNCQGLGNPWIGRSFRKIVREQVPTVCFLMETRLDKEGFDNLYGNLPFQNKIIVKHPDSGEGLAFLWKNEVSLEVINFTVNHVLAKVTEEDGFVWHLTGFYGWSEAQQKENSWRLLKYLQSFVVGPWVVIGDFNAYLHASEKKSVRQPQFSQIEAFRDALNFCHLQDLGYKGIHTLGVIRDPGKLTPRFDLIEVLQIRNGQVDFNLVKLCICQLMLRIIYQFY